MGDLLLGANEIHIYSTHPCTAILDVNFVQKVLKKLITHPTYN